MGGGDLNTKKSWHPNTIKNQEKVWKAEQIQANENKRMEDLRKEIKNERFREELREQGLNSGVLTEKPNKKLDWMYKEPTESVDREQYLLGKAIDKTFEKIVETEKSSQSLLKTSKNHVEHECIPFSIRNYRNSDAGSSENQVDMARKLLEDPLVAIRKREVESRTQLLQNPVKLKELSMLLKADEQRHKMKKEKKRQKKKKKDKDELEDKIFEKLKRLDNDELNIDLKKLLSSEGASHSKKKKKRSKEVESDSDSDSKRKKHKKSHDKEKKHDKEQDDRPNKRKHSEEPERSERKEKQYGLTRPDGSRYHSSDRSKHDSRERSDRSRLTKEPSTSWKKPPRKQLTEEEKEEKRREMMKDAVKRDSDREKNIKYYKTQDKLEEMKNKSTVSKGDFMTSQLRAVAVHGSVESRIKSNIYNIQRSGRDMDKNFARR